MNLRRPFVLVTALALAACSPRPETQTAEAASSAATMSRGPQAASSTFPAVAPRFARLPDRGSLVVYPVEPVVRLDGAYTWHQAGISEAHARRAIDTGHLQLTTPSGEHLDFRYERHVEHPNGDWTWIGSMNGDDAQEAIITFGEKAAFGSISQPGKEPLRLTIRNGASWLIETDPRKIAGINSVGTRPTEPDFIVAPDVAGKVVDRKAQAAGAVMTGSAATGTAAAGATPATTVDVALGYTPGFVSYYGGDSQAVTRLNNMVDITNEAYVNSQIDARIRLVRTVLVNYTDSNSNDTALEELTGFVAPSTRTTPAAVFSELRSARDAYGADLVSLVRRYNTPENEGCGIAWLIGGGRSGIDSSDAFFGYSVVSDGRDSDVDGKTYFCRDETLAHELGHNMGSAHDRDTSDGDDNVLQNDEYGAFDYSFGYRATSSTGNFYTIMAYGDSGQTRYRVFSNPRVSICGGLACGIANQADNARSIQQVVGIVSGFRASVMVSPATRVTHNDFNADGNSDLLWSYAATNAIEISFLNSQRAITGRSSYTLPPNLRIVMAARLNSDAATDLLVVDPSSNTLFSWINNGNGTFSAVPLASFGSGWTVPAVGDLNSDGVDDLVFEHTSGGLQISYLAEGRLSYSVTFGLPSGYSVKSLADVDGSGGKDLVLNNSATRSVRFWIARGNVFEAREFGGYSAGWQIVGTGDYNCDGSEDIAWNNSSANIFEFSFLANGYISSSAAYSHEAGAQIGSFLEPSTSRCTDPLIVSPARTVVAWSYSGQMFGGQLLAGYNEGWRLLR